MSAPSLADRLVDDLIKLSRFPDPLHRLPSLEILLTHWLREAEHATLVRTNALTTENRRRSERVLIKMRTRPRGAVARTLIEGARRRAGKASV